MPSIDNRVTCSNPMTNEHELLKWITGQLSLSDIA